MLDLIAHLNELKNKLEVREDSSAKYQIDLINEFLNKLNDPNGALALKVCRAWDGDKFGFQGYGSIEYNCSAMFKALVAVKAIVNE